MRKKKLIHINTGFKTLCWIREGTTDLSRYAGHRKVYEEAFGKLPLASSGYHGNHVCHSCDIPACLRPSHFYYASAGKNIHDACVSGLHCGALSRAKNPKLGKFMGAWMPLTRIAKIAARKYRKTEA